MHQFYFNDCVTAGNLSLNNLVQSLMNTIREYDSLIKMKIGVENGIILEKEAEKNIICGESLKSIIISIPDEEREIRTLAYSYFTKYPIQYYLKSDNVDEDLLKEEFCFGALDATNLAIARYYNCFLFSLLSHPTIKNNSIQIIGRNSTIDIDNLYGEVSNTHYIETQIRKINASSLSLFEQLKLELNFPAYTSSFEKAFLSESEDVQKSIIEMFSYAKKRGLSTPYFPDTKIIADVTPDNNNKKSAKIYELRVYRPKALRIYFYEHKGAVYVSKLGYKADYKEENSNAQSKDIKKALDEIYKMIKTHGG